MVDLPKKKVGIIACSGEELPEGTVTRLAALKVLEELRPSDTVTICLPLFLAGGEGDRAFARFYPTIALDGCDKRCAARGTEMYSGKPAASVVISELIDQNGFPQPFGMRQLDEAGRQIVNFSAEQVANLVDILLDKRWNRHEGEFTEETPAYSSKVQTTCACRSDLPVQEVLIEGQTVTLIALPLIFQHLHEAGKVICQDNANELLELVRIYNPIPTGDEEAYTKALVREFTTYCKQKSLNYEPH